ncbi:uncharacterized protein BDW43DRAFT_40198 [Aspergillus alliaceus]|uniref:uncharacterized protein n=1 Tax=Petromyces alliaceus TaxID=209559 RepID=UPI0012A740B2|nr:uncharacterized protein BDW43DRAFT_40198 [Aspergillus alliaceus]KAB8235129.1 hypothetical protein BDW43DRAFT_40198 [Aspergillus alliaceus]
MMSGTAVQLPIIHACNRSTVTRESEPRSCALIPLNRFRSNWGVSCCRVFREGNEKQEFFSIFIFIFIFFLTCGVLTYFQKHWGTCVSGVTFDILDADIFSPQNRLDPIDLPFWFLFSFPVLFTAGM